MTEQQRVAFLAAIDEAFKSQMRTTIDVEDPKFTLKVEYTPHND